MAHEQLRTLTDHGHTIGKAVGDVSSLGVVVGTIVEFLPAWAALMTIVWTGIRIYETRTVQKWLGKYKE